jgi:hypothetical protein
MEMAVLADISVPMQHQRFVARHIAACPRNMFEEFPLQSETYRAYCITPFLPS